MPNHALQRTRSRSPLNAISLGREVERNLYRPSDLFRAFLFAPIGAAAVTFLAALAAIVFSGPSPLLEHSTPLREALQVPTIVAPYAYLLTFLAGGAIAWRANRRALRLLSGKSALLGLAVGLVASLPAALFISGPHTFVPLASVLVLLVGAAAGTVTGLLFAAVLNAA